METASVYLDKESWLHGAEAALIIAGVVPPDDAEAEAERLWQKIHGKDEDSETDG